MKTSGAIGRRDHFPAKMEVPKQRSKWYQGKSKENQRKATQEILLRSTMLETLNLLLLKPEEGKT